MALHQTVRLAGMLFFTAALLCAQTSFAGVRIPVISKARQITSQKAALGDWQLKISRSIFSNEIVCHLRSKNKRVFYVADALGFRFGKRLDTLNAWVQIDGDPAYRWRDDLPELARLGVAIDARNLDAPTDGIIWIPVAKLADVNKIAIQPAPAKRVTLFRLRGFAGLHDIAQSKGCTPEARFVR